jgi:hypothetical protein
MQEGLHKSMAYRAVIMSEDAAGALAQSFVASFPRGGDGETKTETETEAEARKRQTQYSNQEATGACLNPVTSAIFDLCVVAIRTASNTLGYLLITDED